MCLFFKQNTSYKLRISDWNSDVCSSDLASRPPGFLRREAEDRRQPGGEAGEQLVEHRSARAPAQRVRPVAVEHVLAHIEVEGREVDGADGVDRLVEGVEVEVFYVLAHLAVELDRKSTRLNSGH